MEDDAVSQLVRRVEGNDDLLSRLRRAARLGLPLTAAVAVVNNGDDGLLDLKLPRVVAFPEEGASSTQAVTDEELITELVRLRSERIRYLLVPASSLAWFVQRSSFRQHVETYRVVLNEEDTCIIYALAEPEDWPADGIGRDGHPVPPPEMVYLTAGLFHERDVYKLFHELGELGVSCIRTTLQESGLEIAAFESILDFGCGCGRVMRHLRSLTGPRLSGSDYNPYLVGWCQSNLTFAQFRVNGLGPPLDFEDGEFDFVYAISVFSHFVEAQQLPWALELERVIKPGGYALITMPGAHHLPKLQPEDQKRFEAGEVVVVRPDRVGTNDTVVFYPEPYVRDVLIPQTRFEIVAWEPVGAKDANQDAVLLKRT